MKTMNSFNFLQLDSTTRALMLEEFEYDKKRGALFLSERLTVTGRTRYSDFLEKALREGDDATLAAALKPYFEATELRQGKPIKMNKLAHETLAQGEFNRYYLRAICLLALETDDPFVTVYRGKAVSHDRTDTQHEPGDKILAQNLLDDLREETPAHRKMDFPAGPNSGLTAYYGKLDSQTITPDYSLLTPFYF